MNNTVIKILLKTKIKKQTFKILIQINYKYNKFNKFKTLIYKKMIIKYKLRIKQKINKNNQLNNIERENLNQNIQLISKMLLFMKI